MDYFNILGTNVRALRIERNLTQEQLADLCDLHHNYAGEIKRGDCNVSLKNIVRIAQALNVEPSELLLYKKITYNKLRKFNSKR